MKSVSGPSLDVARNAESPTVTILPPEKRRKPFSMGGPLTGWMVAPVMAMEKVWGGDLWVRSWALAAASNAAVARSATKSERRGRGAERRGRGEEESGIGDAWVVFTGWPPLGAGWRP